MNKFWGEPFDVAVRRWGSLGGTLPSAAFEQILCLGALCC